MPFIHIRSLPADDDVDVAAALEAISAEFAAATGIDIMHVTATWEFVPAQHWAVAGRAASRRAPASSAVLVDLLSPDFNDAETVETMVSSVGRSVARHAGAALETVFVNHRAARSGMVFDNGDVVRW